MTALNVDEVAGALREVIPQLEQQAVTSMKAAVDLTYERMGATVPHGETGRLARDIAHTTHKIGSGVTGTVTPFAPEAPFVNFGTGKGKTVRGTQGQAYFASTGHPMSAAMEAAHPFEVKTASSWGAKTPGKPLALHLGSGIVYREWVRGQRAQNFVAKTLEEVAGEVINLLAAGAERATERIFP